jgi:hypothetical protein
MKLQRLLTLGLCAAVALLTLQTPASAAEVLRDDVTPHSYQAPAHNDPFLQVAVGAVSINATAGQVTYVSGVISFANAGVRTLVDTSVQCANGASNAGRVVHGENIGGDTQSSASVTARLLARAPSTGILACTLYVYSRSLGAASTFSVTGGHILIGTRSVPGGVQAAASQQIAKLNSPVWTPRIAGTVTAGSYTNLWQAPAGATSLNIFADLSLTVCATGGSDDFGCPAASTTGTGTAHTTLIITQFTAAGAVCTPIITDPLTSTIPYLLHHDVAYHNLPSVAIQTTGGCAPLFSIYVKVEVSTSRAVLTNTTAPSGEMGLVFVLPN